MSVGYRLNGKTVNRKGMGLDSHLYGMIARVAKLGLPPKRPAR